MRLAVCLLTADRSEYTGRTLESFVENADRDEYIRLHADDGSASLSNMHLAEAANFLTVYQSTVRRGPMAALRFMWGSAFSLGATHILHLENDFEFVAPLPDWWGKQFDSIRLYGDKKARSGERTQVGPHLMGTKTPIAWNQYGPHWQRGFAHWGGMPSITRADMLVNAVNVGDTFKSLSLGAMNRLDTLRPMENIVWHIGEERTPGAKFNA